MRFDACGDFCRARCAPRGSTLAGMTAFDAVPPQPWASVACFSARSALAGRPGRAISFSKALLYGESMGCARMAPLLGYEPDATDGALVGAPVFLSVERDLLAPREATECQRLREPWYGQRRPYRCSATPRALQ